MSRTRSFEVWASGPFKQTEHSTIKGREHAGKVSVSQQGNLFPLPQSPKAFPMTVPMEFSVTN
jgi:hypothetical protein